MIDRAIFIPEHMVGSVKSKKIKNAILASHYATAKLSFTKESLLKKYIFFAGPLSFLMRYDYIKVDSYVKLLVVLDWKIK